MSDIKVLIADDHHLMVDGIKSLLDDVEGLEIVGVANDGEETMVFVSRKPVDVILLDLQMPKMNGFQVAEQIKKKYPKIRILVLTMYDKPGFIRELLESGVDGYVLKNTGKEELVEGIKTVNNGEKFFSKEVSGIFYDSFRKEKDENTFLTTREIEIIKLIAQELTSQEIADKLFLSHFTVDTHRRNIINKLGVKNTAGLIRYAYENGYFDLQN
ncbi:MULTISPECIES: response regulator transcription factor [unclassified Imperialibacter]|uniref:response regulator transcription factor n=1 Tax=unclassified Imperialibacter TaxID=2629706 RepID=UPI001259D3A0|nr:MULTISPECIES: response regulator transcription factor [unclassified Imperialibacter]CAD5258578.1 Response regulator containing a CheY-like receiver domain and an HTH DNA-binding domain [Imperialibacter sp. 89]CAD5265497.1 Response regulator containing a CheY-like receiver domain and an HTH DNA-binding domain [Imperialibacter sp. 75]VVT21582.1 Response regulator containing a CheY-like receiver domain and an HTH DNA-binding domain [Imperialibacter sp. EC-SDR9]|tara:strand:+ start:2264 stop:2905 length:642 start_codon:yes stop_codon:yes gene_type:complete